MSLLIGVKVLGSWLARPRQRRLRCIIVVMLLLMPVCVVCSCSFSPSSLVQILFASAGNVRGRPCWCPAAAYCRICEIDLKVVAAAARGSTPQFAGHLGPAWEPESGALAEADAGRGFAAGCPRAPVDIEVAVLGVELGFPYLDLVVVATLEVVSFASDRASGLAAPRSGHPSTLVDFIGLGGCGGRHSCYGRGFNTETS